MKSVLSLLIGVMISNSAWSQSLPTRSTQWYEAQNQFHQCITQTTQLWDLGGLSGDLKASIISICSGSIERAINMDSTLSIFDIQGMEQSFRRADDFAIRISGNRSSAELYIANYNTTRLSSLYGNGQVSEANQNLVLEKVIKAAKKIGY